MRLQDVILRGLAADQPAATTVGAGTLYYSTDTQTTERCSEDDPHVWEDYSDAGAGGSGITELTGDVTAGPGSGSQAATLANTAVTPDTYVNPTITVDSKGRITAAANGESGFTIEIDGGGSAITTGIKARIEWPFPGTVTAVRLGADVSGSIVLDIWKDTYANYPPTIADTITASAKPTLSSAIKSEDVTLTGWTTSFSEGDWWFINVDSATTVTFVAVAFRYTRT